MTVPTQLTDGKIRTWELMQYVTAFLPGGFDDWPANIQDAVMAAMEKKAAEVELPLCIVAAYCDVDYGDNEKSDRPFLRIIVSEIVAKDTGYEKRMIDEMMKTIH